MAGFSREVARRVFAEELLNSSLAFRDSDDQYAPQYLLTPTGARCNRIFLVGTLIERDDIGGDTEYWRGRIVDPTGSVRIYAGQYDPEACQMLANIEPPAFVAVVGKPKLYQPEDGGTVVNIRAESIQKVDESTRNQWILDTAVRTHERLKALKNVVPTSLDFSTADKTPVISSTTDAERALQHYSTDAEKYRQMVIRALNSLRADLTKNKGTAPIMPGFAKRDAKPEVKQETAKPAEKEMLKPKQEIKSDKSDIPKKSKQKAKGTLTDWPESDEVETIDFGKKS